MKTNQLTIALTVINVGILIFSLARVLPAAQPDVIPVLRVRALEIIDQQGNVRAQIIVAPATTMPDGQKYPETTLLRLIDPNGRPAVKIAASVDGSGISLAGDSEKREWSGIQILAEGMGSSIKLTDKDGSENLITTRK